jgi:hypothetical protein
MKKITTIIIIITVLSTVLLAKGASFKGRVIYINKDYIEVKYGKTEKLFYVNDKSVFKKGETNVTFADIKPCQVVKVVYTVANKTMYITTCEIIKESDCE